MSEDGNTHGNPRNLSRIFTTILCLSFLFAIVGVPLYFHLSKSRSVQFPCDESLSVPLFNPVYHPNGSVADGDDLYPPGYYFSTNGTTRGCLCALKHCIRKCCSENERYVKVVGSYAKCVKFPGPSHFANISAVPVHTETGEAVKVDQDHFRILYGDVCRYGKFMVHPNFEESHILVNGIISFQNTGNGDKTYHDVSKYCLESINGSEELRAFLCFPPTEDDEEQIKFLLYPIAMIVSVPFLLVTIVVYCTLPALRNLHGKCLVCQCLCLLITYLELATIMLMGSGINDLLCTVFAFMVQFSFLGSFFWFNVMSFDIWWSLSGFRPVEWGLKTSEHKKFLLYSIYGWGMPLAIVAISVGMDMIHGIPDSFIKPGFGQVKCWFVDKAGAFLYFYLPSGIVLILNTVMFVTMAFNVQSQTGKNLDKVRFSLYLKLFILMGLNWSFELLSYFLGGPSSMWFVTDLINSLQGVAIFYIFVCRHNILKKINKKLCPCWNLFIVNSLQSSTSLCDSVTKTEDVVLALKSLSNGKESKCEETQLQVT